VPPAEVTDAGLAARYPFALIAVASHFFLNTVFGNNPRLRRRSGPPAVLISPSDAARHGLADGTPVRVHNDRGGFEAILKTSDRIRDGVAATTKGYWAKLDGAGSTPNATVAERDADLAAGPAFHDTRVTITATPT
jgi:anaerobic selenocysteine-containing dehydrogenase